MLTLISLTSPARVMYLTSLTLLASLLGAPGIQPAKHHFIQWGHLAAFEKVSELFHVWGFWTVLVSGFSLAPNTRLTISAGVLSLSCFLLVIVLAEYTPSIEPKLSIYIESIGWFTVVTLNRQFLFRSF